ncbi:hypothetical protein BDW59DRAFT_163452 [Aspergillus cavernicola]|uniref:C2H2-type domain-containing protein n=1 Tax=Aspergillus cavernicola TaxID=176166 RepID=A0ABR4I6H0_9EURO
MEWTTSSSQSEGDETIYRYSTVPSNDLQTIALSEMLPMSFSYTDLNLSAFFPGPPSGGVNGAPLPTRGSRVRNVDMWSPATGMENDIQTSTGPIVHSPVTDTTIQMLQPYPSSGHPQDHTPPRSRHLYNGSGSSNVAMQVRAYPNTIPMGYPSLSDNDSLHLPHNTTGMPGQTTGSQNNPPLLCEWKDCSPAPYFNRVAELMRHIKSIHVSPDAHSCPVENCGKRFGRRDQLQLHTRRSHKLG